MDIELNLNPTKIYIQNRPLTEKLTTNLFKYTLNQTIKHIFKIKIQKFTSSLHNQIDDSNINLNDTYQIIIKSYKIIEELFGADCFIDIKQKLLYSNQLPSTKNSNKYDISINNFSLIFEYSSEFSKDSDFKSLCNSYINSLLISYIKGNPSEISLDNQRNLILFLNKKKQININFESIVGIKHYNKKINDDVFFNPNQVFTIICNHPNKSVYSLIHELELTLLNGLGIEVSSEKENKIGVIYDNINEFIKGKEIVTKYNNYKLYTIDKIDFTKTPSSVFIDYNNYNLSLVDYYKTRYNITIKNLNQPLLIYRSTFNKNDIFLIPELCFLVDSLKSDEDKTDISNYLLSQSYKDSFIEILNFVSSLLNHVTIEDKSKEQIRILNIKNIIGLSVKPLNVYGTKFDKVIFSSEKEISGERRSFQYEISDGFSKKLMSSNIYSQPPIPLLYILSYESDLYLANNMISFFDKLRLNNEYIINKIEIIKIKSSSNKLADWENGIKHIINNNLSSVIFLIPSSIPEKDIIYRYIKKMLYVNYAIPHQIVLTSSITPSNNIKYDLKGVMINIINQLSVKLNGEQWSIENIPFSSIPCMIIGVHESFFNGRVIFSISASYNNTFTRYYSDYSYIEDYNDDSTSNTLKELVNKAIENFLICQMIFPSHIIIYRDNNLSSFNNELYSKEALNLKEFLNSHPDYSDIYLTYIEVKEKFSFIKFFSNHEGKLYNPSPGKLIIDTLTNQKNEFYIISSLNEKGLNLSTYYKIIYDDSCSTLLNDYQELSYKLCYLYFNSYKSINYPAPIKYAKKLAFFCGMILSNEEESVYVSEKLKNQIKSVFYI